jgi:hypothetical protein
MKQLVVVSSVIANKPGNGGNARMVLNWLQGLERLGLDVFFVEPIRSDSCVDEAGRPAAAADSANRAYFERVLGSHGFGERAALVCDGNDGLAGATVYGSTAAELVDLFDEADLLINISGHLSIDTLKDRCRRKAYVDLDPGYTQIWHAEGSGAARLHGHDLYFTVGQRVGSPAFRIPTHGIEWRPIRQPIVLSTCDTTSQTGPDRFTTIASWRGAYAPVTYSGHTFVVKAHEFRKIVELPRMSQQAFEVALDIHPGDARDLDALRASGWSVVDPRRVARLPDDYCRYIEGSTGECSAAQGIYVQTRSGWFSDRSARYLASGKPVLVQDTGFSTPERSGEGLVVFDTVVEAAAAAERIMRDYDSQCEAARQLAERYFDSDTELGRFLEDAGLG